MNRILKRPMFRMGGSTGTGITSGLDRPGYNQGSNPFSNTKEMGMAMSRSAIPQLLPSGGTTPKPAAGFLNPQGVGLGMGTLPGFLTQFGLNLASATPRGNIFATAAEAAKDPFERFQAAKFEEAQSKREFDKDVALQLLKNDDVNALPYQQKIQYLMDTLKLGEAEAIKFIETSKTDYSKKTDEAKIQDELNKMVTQDYTIAEFRALILPKLPAEKRPRASDKIKTRDGKFPRTPAVGVIYPDSDTGRLYEYNGGEPDEITSYTDVTGQYTG